MNTTTYRNGNYYVYFNFEDGTKIRYNKEDCFNPEFPESMDLKITNSCDMGCPYCHENSVLNGKHADLLSPSFIDNLHPYTEIAIGGGNPLEHPNLLQFLMKCKDLKLICNMTVNQVHFEKQFNFIKQLVDAKLIYGLGISLVKINDSFINKVKEIPNAVIHVIAGVISEKDLNELKNNNLKLLVLGYKEVRRGKDLFGKDPTPIMNKINSFKKLLPILITENWFNVVSFDNLALKQLNVKELFPDQEWNIRYMGDDGIDGQMTSASMFVDMVERKFAKNSCATENERYPIMNDIKDMYAFLRS